MLRTRSIVGLTIAMLVGNIVGNYLYQLCFLSVTAAFSRFVDTSLYIGLVGGFLAYQAHRHPDYDDGER